MRLMNLGSILSLPLLLETSCQVGAFAAKKKGGRRNQASSNRGFGTPPPSLDDILESFPTPLPGDVDTMDCPCGSGLSYPSCCELFHSGKAMPATPMDVLRSRYSAFSVRNIKYVIDTTHPVCRDYQDDQIAWAKDLNKGGMFDSYDFVKLETVGEEENNEDEAFLEFKVTLRAREDTLSALAGQTMTVREKSRFVRTEEGAWLYANGEVKPEVEGLEDTVLNK